jgi:rhodanese-related sulfurtransferase
MLRQIKSRIEEVDPSLVREQLSNGALVIDVREAEEWSTGHIPGAKHVPKSFLESRIEGAAPDRSQHVILYCQSGNRSAWARRLPCTWPPPGSERSGSSTTTPSICPTSSAR